MGSAYDEYLRTQTIEEKQARLRCPQLEIDFVIPARLHTFLDGVLDLVQWQIEKARVSQQRGHEHFSDVD